MESGTWGFDISAGMGLQTLQQNCQVPAAREE